ncbi:MAG: hypothetical protein WC679_03115 [Bacteroidales bacterium]|jgi:hypothetical protein
MIRKNITTILISILLLSSPIIFTQCSLFKNVNKAANSINDISDMIKNYDNQAKHYIDVVKKAKKGDLKAIAESGKLLGKAKDYKKELDKYSKNATSEQKKNIESIEKSILNASKGLLKK